MRTFVVVLVMGGTVTSDGWFGADKLKHFLASAFIHSVAYSAGTAAGLERPVAQAAAGTVTISVGVWKEAHDRRVGGAFSARDLGWDAAGALAAGALMNGTR